RLARDVVEDAGLPHGVRLPGGKPGVIAQLPEIDAQHAQTLGLAIGERREQDARDDREHRGGRTDADREYANHRERIPPLARETATRLPRSLPEPSHELRQLDRLLPAVCERAHAVGNALHVAEALMCRAPSVGFAEAGGAQLLHDAFHVKIDFVAHVGAHVRSPEAEVAVPRRVAAVVEAIHLAGTGEADVFAANTFATAATNAFHVTVCSASWRRPAIVNE